MYMCQWRTPDQILACHYINQLEKLDRVGPVDNRPFTKWLNQNNNKKINILKKLLTSWLKVDLYGNTNSHLVVQGDHLSEKWANTNINLLICLLPIWHLFLCRFIWWRINWRYVNKNYLSQLIIPEIMRILLAFSYFPTYSEIWSPPVLPLLRFP